MTTSVERPQAPFGRRSAVVIERREHGPYITMTVRDAAGPRPLAGQFYMLQTESGWGGGEDGRPYLPRALSFARVAEAPDGGILLDFLFEDVGPGTHKLGGLDADEELLLAGPFGNGFAFDPSTWPILVAGGIGLAPIVALDDEIRDLDGVRSNAFFGVRNAEYATAAKYYRLDHQLATEDGSAGATGYVTELIAPLLAESDSEQQKTVYACGPPPMLEAVRALCAEHDVPCQLAMESGMACGFGACFGCVVPTIDGYVRLCVDGPVLQGDAIETALVEGASH